MYIRCWGARGSIPVSGKQFIKYGGDTTCIEIRTKSDDLIIVDAGTGIRRLGNKLMEDSHTHLNLFFTHAHWDHIMGFPFFKPIYSPDFEIRMLRCPIPAYVKKMLSKVMTAPNFPVEYADVKAKIIYEEDCLEEVTIGSVTATPIKLSHPNTGNGYRFTEDGKTFVFLTDNELDYLHPGGLEYPAYLEFAKGADILFHDAEYTANEYKLTRKWGHSIYTRALSLAMEAGVKKFGLFHHNQDRSDTQLDEMVEACKAIIAEKESSLECFGVAADMSFIL